MTIFHAPSNGDTYNNIGSAYKFFMLSAPGTKAKEETLEGDEKAGLLLLRYDVRVSKNSAVARTCLRRLAYRRRAATVEDIVTSMPFEREVATGLA
ncbi:hypothetical protein TNCV_3650161 [Trichonephila clavipes]|nr:hypothetical protein TNCV_3650161 [Trichonephila clavipes]